MSTAIPDIKRRFRRPDTYRAAANIIGCSVPHLYEVVHGNRETTPENAKSLLAWAKRLASSGHAASPAVVAALRNLS